MYKTIYIWGGGSDPAILISLEQSSRSSLFPPCNLCLSSPLARFEQSSRSRAVGSHSVVYRSSKALAPTTSSLRFEVISALGPRLSLISLCSIVKSRLSLETGVAFSINMYQDIPFTS